MAEEEKKPYGEHVGELLQAEEESSKKSRGAKKLKEVNQDIEKLNVAKTYIEGTYLPKADAVDNPIYRKDGRKHARGIKKALEAKKKQKLNLEQKLSVEPSWSVLEKLHNECDYSISSDEGDELNMKFYESDGEEEKKQSGLPWDGRSKFDGW